VPPPVPPSTADGRRRPPRSKSTPAVSVRPQTSDGRAPLRSHNAHHVSFAAAAAATQPQRPGTAPVPSPEVVSDVRRAFAASLRSLRGQENAAPPGRWGDDGRVAMEVHGAVRAGGGLRPHPPPGRFPGRAVPTSVRRAVRNEAVSQRSAAAAAARAPEPTTADDAHAIPAMVADWGFAGGESPACGPGRDERTQQHLPHLNPLVHQQRNNPLLFSRGDPQHGVQVRVNPRPQPSCSHDVHWTESRGLNLPPPHPGRRGSECGLMCPGTLSAAAKQLYALSESATVSAL
jgi:hypothetical protein